jgi:hypothetical protein
VLIPLLLAIQQLNPVQTVREDRAACRECAVQVSSIATLGGASAPEIPGDLATVTRDRRGRFFVQSIHNRSNIFVYHPNGRFVKLIGRAGEGPGEFRRVRELMVWGDTLFASDAALGRISSFSTDGEFLAARPFMPGTDGIVRLREGLVAFGRSGAPSAAGLPLHLVGDGRTIIRSFGASDVTVHPSDMFSIFRSIAPSSDTAVWAAAVNRYEITLWSPTGKALLTFVRNVPWFPRWAKAGHREDVSRPVPRLECVREDGEGHLIVLLHVPRADWRPTAKAPEGEMPILPDYERKRYVDTVIEVVRIRDAKVIATTRLHDYLSCYLASGENLYTSRSEEDYGAAVHVWRIDLVQPSPR